MRVTVNRRFYKNLPKKRKKKKKVNVNEKFCFLSKNDDKLFVTCTYLIYQIICTILCTTIIRKEKKNAEKYV